VVLTMAAGSGAATGGVAEGALLLLVYSLGLGVPFLLAGLGVSRLTGAVAWLRQHTRVINLVSGALLVLVGLLFISGQFFQMSIWFQRTFPEVPFSL
ncbi:MAG TPA: cytochrome c biogenesis protein CcdA, partial [Actinomycetota bacterium]|nr:cytochrome c biogenesis protein CcdA [Actinomycetota bacterium]